MKTTLRLPTQDQYAFIEIEAEVTSIEDAVVAYADAMRLIKGNAEGLPDKEFNSFLDQYLTDNSGNLEIYTKMSLTQQHVIQEIKKALKRIAYKNR